jgi:hypothetical protein
LSSVPVKSVQVPPLLYAPLPLPLLSNVPEKSVHVPLLSLYAP